MNTKNITIPKNATIIIVVDAPEVCFAPDENPAELLLHFYRKLGWNGDDVLDPRKVRTTKEVYNRLSDQMHKRCPDPVAVAMLMVNSGPGTEDCIPEGKVYLLDGWITPNIKEGDDTYVA